MTRARNVAILRAMDAEMAFAPPTDLAFGAHRDPASAGVDFADSPFAGPDEPAHRAVFTMGDRIHWRARFGGPAGTVRLDVITVAVDADGWEQVVSGHEMWIAHPDAQDYSGWIDLPAYRAPGWFALRFVRGGQVLAEGAFDVVDRRRDGDPSA